MQTKLVSYIKLFDSSSLCEFLDSLLRPYQTEEVWNVYIKLSQMTGIQGYKIWEWRARFPGQLFAPPCSLTRKGGRDIMTGLRKF